MLAAEQRSEGEERVNLPRSHVTGWYSVRSAFPPPRFSFVAIVKVVNVADCTDAFHDARHGAQASVPVACRTLHPMASGRFEFFMLPEEFGRWEDQVGDLDGVSVWYPRRDGATLYLGSIGFKDDQRPETSPTLGHFQRLRRSLRRETKSGLWVRNMVTGAQAYYRNVWISEGATQFVKRGGSLRMEGVANLSYLLDSGD